MHQFVNPPMIFNTASRGLCVEGDHDSGADMDTVHLAAVSYGFLVPPNTRLTGAQWIAAIARKYDAVQPRNAAVIEAIRKVMLVEEFADHRVLFAGGSPVWRGPQSELGVAMSQQPSEAAAAGPATALDAVTAEQLEAADVAMARRYVTSHGGRIFDLTCEKAEPSERVFEAHLFGLRGQFRIALPQGEPPTMLERVLTVLQESAGSEPANPAIAATDWRDELELAGLLCAHLNYGSLIAHVPKGMAAAVAQPSGARRNPSKPLEVSEIAEQLTDLVGRLVGAGWPADGSGEMFLCRPAPIVNPHAALRPFESLVHSRLIGWRLPRGLVAKALERSQERAVVHERQHA